MGEPDDMRQFTKSRPQIFHIEVLKAVAQQMLIKQGVQIELDSRRSEVWLTKVYRDIACIVGKTYVELGDEAQLADDEALLLIREILVHINERLFEGSKNRKLPRRYRRLLSASVNWNSADS
jgi:Mg-chelatase subunit ChlI